MEMLKAILRMLLESGWIKYRQVFLALAAVSSVLIGWFDYVTTDEVNLSFVYLLPVFLTTLAVGRTGGLGMALACAAIKIVADVYSDQPYANSFIYAFNGLGLFIAFAAFSLLLDMLRTAYRRECEIYRKDGLTGLPNRQDFFAVVGDRLSSSKQAGKPHTLLLLDTDNLKDFNAANGYHVGDIALQAIAKVLGKTLGKNGIVYRIGGDDFAVTLIETELQKVRQTAGELQKEVTAAIQNKGWQLSVSLCIATCSDATISLEDVLRRSITALNAARRDAGPGIVVEWTC